MPAIRDYSQSYNTTNTLRHLEVPMPAYQAGDLLVAIMSADTGTTQAWVGFDRVLSAQYDDGGAFTDETTDANSTTAGDIFFVPATPAVNDAFYVGGSLPFRAAAFQFSTQGAGVWTVTWEYYNGSTWTALSGVSDGTTNFRAAVTIPVQVTYTMPTDWATTTINGVSAYYIRGRVSAYTSITTRPIGTQVWLVDGWEQLTSQSNTANLAILYKTATASEFDTTFLYSIAETANGAIISIRDVDPKCDTKSYNAVQIDVVASAGTFTRTTGSYLTDGFTVGMAIKTTGFTNGGNNTYKIIQSVTATVITVTNTTGLVNETGNGNERVVNWLWGDSTGFTGANTSAAKANMPTMTTDVNNCLVLWAAANSGAGVPSIIEGACQLIFGKDGSAHSDACSWGWQATAGTTATVGYSTLSASATKLMVASIRPKGDGTSIVPGYTVSDASVYVTPCTGAAYNGDSAPVNTLTTPFTGTVNGRPVANGGTTYTAADAGINSYHAVARCIGAATAGSFVGTTMTIVARTTLASKNILFHISPFLPVDIQTTDSVSLTGACGVAIGLASTASNFKVWHVGGSGTSWDTSLYAPVVINTDATAGLLQTTGTLNTASITEIGFMISGKNVIPDWKYCSVWALDNCVLSGGSTSEPLDIIQTEIAYARGHERRSAIRQGNGQLLLLGPIQYGNGGTNPLYLTLENSALEFPRQYNKSLKEVFYNSVDNFAGVTYYPGPSDTVIHRSSVISSPSRYKWGLHESASASAEYDFSGLSVIGAGQINLSKDITIEGLSITDYSTLSVSGLYLSNSEISEVPATSYSIFASSGTNFDTCTIDVSLLASGNSWIEVEDPTIFSGCSFLGGGGHAIEITASGEFDFNANTFTDFGTNESNLAAILNSSGGEVILNIIGGGNTPTYKNIAPSMTIVNNKKYITLTGLQPNTEVRAYLDSGGNNGVEIDGIENSGTTFTFAVDPNTTINIMINHLSYLPADIWQLEVGTTDLTLPIKQFIDRQYYNPPGPDPLAGQGLMIHDFITGTTQTTSSSTYVTALELNSTVPEGYYIIQWGGTISRTITGGVFGQTRVSINANVVAESEEQFANENYQFPFSGFYYVYLNGAVNVLIEFEGNGQQIDLLLPSIYILGGTP